MRTDKRLDQQIKKYIKKNQKFDQHAKSGKLCKKILEIFFLTKDFKAGLF